MAFSIRLTDEEKKLADSYAKLRAMSVGEAFKRALFEKLKMNTMLPSRRKPIRTT